MAGRSFGKLMQTFAAFGSGTGSADPVNTARGTFHNGMSGMWSVMYWLFVTPVYWISAVWYRRMRSLTLGDWFVERYESKSIGVAYALFGCFYLHDVRCDDVHRDRQSGRTASRCNAASGCHCNTRCCRLSRSIVITYGLLGGICGGVLDGSHSGHLHHCSFGVADPVRALGGG